MSEKKTEEQPGELFLKEYNKLVQKYRCAIGVVPRMEKIKTEQGKDIWGVTFDFQVLPVDKS